MTDRLLDTTLLHPLAMDSADLAAAAIRLRAMADLATMPSETIPEEDNAFFRDKNSAASYPVLTRVHTDPNTGAKLSITLHRRPFDFSGNHVSYELSCHPTLNRFRLEEPIAIGDANVPDDQPDRIPAATWLRHIANLAAPTNTAVDAQHCDQSQTDLARWNTMLQANSDSAAFAASLAQHIGHELPAIVTNSINIIIVIHGRSPYHALRAELEGNGVELNDILTPDFTAAMNAALPVSISIRTTMNASGTLIRLDPPQLTRHLLRGRLDAVSLMRTAALLPPHDGPAIDRERITAK